MNIPRFKQEKSKTCGLASLRMIFAYYDIQVTEKELSSQIKLHSFGLTGFELAQVANHYGFKCTAYTFKQDAFAHRHVQPNTVITPNVTYSNKLFTTQIKQYLQNQNKLIFHHPGRDILKIALDNHKPLIVCTNNASLNRRFHTLANGHYIVITDIDNEFAYYNDPVTGQTDKRPIDMLISSMAIRGQSSDLWAMVIDK